MVYEACPPTLNSVLGETIYWVRFKGYYSEKKSQNAWYSWLMAIRHVVLDRFDTLRQACPTVLLVRATFTGEKLLRATFTEKKLLQATCMFTEIKLQKIESFLCKTGAHFSQYSGNLSPKVGEEQKKKFYASNRC